MIRIAPSLLAADFTKLGEEVKTVTESGAEFLHLDIMDGAFVPNISFGPDVVKQLRRETEAVFDVHLMINKPEKYIEAFANAGADIITVHYEACDKCADVLDLIHKSGKKAGVSVKPGTPASCLLPLMDRIDLILIMTVEPGFGGQKYMQDMEPKIKAARTMADGAGHEVLVEVDGGINENTIKSAAAYGADTFVAGTTFFKSADRKSTVAALKKAAGENYGRE